MIRRTLILLHFISPTFLKKTLTQSLLILTLTACGGGGGTDGATNISPPPAETVTEFTGSVTGVVYSNGSPIEGASIYLGGLEVLTDAGGVYNFSELKVPRESESLIITIVATNYEGITLELLPANQINNSSESTLFIDGFTIQAPDAELNGKLRASIGSDINGLSNQLIELSAANSFFTSGSTQYLWEITSAPEDSSIALLEPNNFRTYLTPISVGTYIVKLTLTDDKGNSSSDEISIFITKTESTPMANAGPYQLVQVGETVTLNGTASADADGDEITYLWESFENYVCDDFTCASIIRPCFEDDACGSLPEGEEGLIIYNAFGDLITTKGWYTQVAELDDVTSATPSFTATEVGEYKFILTVTDGRNTSGFSSTSIVEIDVVQGNIPPMANAGDDRKVVTNNEITLDGSLSLDQDNDFITYIWSFISKPNGSSASLFNELTSTPSFIPDMDGEYVVSLIVNDGEINSEIDNIVIMAGPLAVDSVEISAEKLEVFKGRTLQLNAVATMTDESETTITNKGSWTVSSSSRASITPQGLLTGIKAGTTNVTFTPDDNSLKATTQSIKIKSISEMGDSFSTSLSSSASIINSTIQHGSQFSLRIVNNTGETMSLLRFEVRDSSGIKSFTEDTSLLSGGSLTNGEQVGLQYTVGATGALTPLTLAYTLTDPVTGETFKVSYVYSGPSFP